MELRNLVLNVDGSFEGIDVYIRMVMNPSISLDEVRKSTNSLTFLRRDSSGVRGECLLLPASVLN
jgi:hypothetical protein